MNDLTWIAPMLAEIQETAEPALLAQVIDVEGSHYRRPGARMLLRRDGGRAGGISAGCLEADIERRFDGIASAGSPALLTYDLASESDLVFGLGLGCGGRIEVLVEPLRRETSRLLQRAFETNSGGASCTLLTFISASAATIRRALYSDGGSLLIGESGLSDAAPASPRFRRLANRDGSSLLTEKIAPPPRLLLCGSGADAVFLARVMSEIGWHVIVVSGRDPHRILPLFQGSRPHFLDPESAAREISRTAFSAAVVMSHNFLDDLRCVESLRGCSLAYFGIVGPRARTERLLASPAGVAGGSSPAPIHSPAGLDLGGDTPGETALSIAAELTATYRAANGRPLNGRTGGIHGQEAVVSAALES